MKTWVFFAFVSMFFAGVTAVIAKMGLVGISSELGIVVRTVFVFLLILIFAVFFVNCREFGNLNTHNYLWLGLSAATTSLSWIFYYKALKEGDVSTVAMIDKGSVVIAVVLAYIVLKEQITIKTLLGFFLIVSGLLVIARK